MKRSVIIVNGWKLEAVNYYHKALHLGCCSSPRSASEELLLKKERHTTKKQPFGGVLRRSHSRNSRPKVFCKKDAQHATLLKKGLWHRCFPENFSKFLRTSFLTERLRWLLLPFLNILNKNKGKHLQRSKFFNEVASRRSAL